MRIDGIQPGETFIQTTANNVTEFLRPFVGEIERHYIWPEKKTTLWNEAEKLLGHEFPSQENDYKKTIKLKMLLVTAINESGSFESSYRYGEFFVIKWGGVSTNKELKEKLKPFYLVKDKGLDAFKLTKKLNGVSSWSKYLSLLNRKAAIYDSRVAYSLNTINFIAGNGEYFFPMPEGRSPRLQIIDIETLFVMRNLAAQRDLVTDEDFKHRQISARLKRKYQVGEDQTYRSYLDVLAKVAEQLDLADKETFQIEMLLFAFAPTKVLKSLLDSLKKQS